MLGLLALAAWAAAASQRAVVAELRATASHLRAAEAFEAAQGGLDFARALLGAGTLDAACLPAAAPALSIPQWLEAGPVELACSRLEAGWSCRCPGLGSGAPPLAGHERSTPSFQVRATRVGSGTSVQLQVQGRGSGGAGSASLTMLASPPAHPSEARWRAVPGSWRDF